MPEAIVTSQSESPSPLQAIAEACAWAEGQGIHIIVGSDRWGVELQSRFGMPHWCRTGRTLDPLSALILQVQPPPPEEEPVHGRADQIQAVMDALGVEEAVVAGLVSGIDNEPPSVLWVGTTQAALFKHGFTVGSLIRRGILARVCGGCGDWVTKGKACEKCRREVA